MLRRTTCTLLLALCVLSGYAQIPNPAGQSQWRTCTRVVDGDTVILDGRERVRLIGVDAPESKRPRKPVQRFGKESARYLRTMVEGKRVRLEHDWQRTDRHGRTLGYIYLEDGRFVNATMVRDGYAFALTRYPFKHLEEFRRLEREAREAGRGLWGDSSAQGPR
jgi:micrococcal nuclease